MFDLPLFPLNTVLFPGMPLKLHIFEDRYKQMIRSCLQTGQPFGVALIRHGQEADGSVVDPYRVGCTARILEVEHLRGGQMNLEVLGEKRFLIRSLKYNLPYLVGEMDFYPLQESSRETLHQSGHQLRPWVRQYMKILTEIGDVELSPQHLPHDPLVLAYLAAVLLQVPADQKQGLLAVPRASDLLSDMHALYRREVALLRVITSNGKRENQGIFSMN